MRNAADTLCNNVIIGQSCTWFEFQWNVPDSDLNQYWNENSQTTNLNSIDTINVKRESQTIGLTSATL